MPINRLLTNARFSTVLTYLVMGVLLVVAIVLAGEEIEHHIDSIDAWITNLRPWSVLAFVGLFVVVTSVLVPESVLSIMAGALFGLAWGTAAIVAGTLLAAALQYALSQRFLRARIKRAIAERASLAAIQRSVCRDAFRLQALLRLTPLNPATVSYMLGVAGVRFFGFMLACLALVPTLFIEVYFGYAGKHVARMAGRETPAVYLHDLTVIGGLAVTIIVMVLVSRMARKAIMETVSGSLGSDHAKAQ
ncbi:MAG: VTT domain-containing protein [Geobacteraceae bacterium]|nr:VTT domain-containing protein [Geobacteraceae bacterium]